MHVLCARALVMPRTFQGRPSVARGEGETCTFVIQDSDEAGSGTHDTDATRPENGADLVARGDRQGPGATHSVHSWSTCTFFSVRGVDKHQQRRSLCIESIVCPSYMQHAPAGACIIMLVPAVRRV